jgi:hypothetical protein
MRIFFLVLSGLTMIGSSMLLTGGDTSRATYFLVLALLELAVAHECKENR